MINLFFNGAHDFISDGRCLLKNFCYTVSLVQIHDLKLGEYLLFSHSTVSDSFRLHGLQPTRLLHPWDFPGKSTGVGCHRPQLFLAPWILHSVQYCPTVCDPMDYSTPASLSITNSQSLLKLMSIELVMPSNHLILCHPLLFPPSIFPSIRVFSNESVLHIKWPKY